jgi:hypothetical protein
MSQNITSCDKSEGELTRPCANQPNRVDSALWYNDVDLVHDCISCSCSSQDVKTSVIKCQSLKALYGLHWLQSGNLCDYLSERSPRSKMTLVLDYIFPLKSVTEQAN